MNSSNYFITLVAILKIPAPTPMRQSLKLSDAVEIREIDRTHGFVTPFGGVDSVMFVFIL